MLALTALLLLQSPALPARQLIEELRIAAPSAEEDFLSITGITEVGERIYVADPRAPAIYRFDRAGKPLGSVGRAGAGPGEFRFPGPIGGQGDSLWVWDGGQRRVVVYDPTGRATTTIVLRAPLPGTGSVLADGSVLLVPGWNPSRAHPDAALELPVVHSGVDGAPRDTVLMLEVERGQMRMDLADGGYLSSAQPFGDAPILFVATKGDRLIRVDRSTTGPAAVRVTAIGVDGRVQWTKELPYSAAPVEPTLIDSLIRHRTHPPDPRTPAVTEESVRAALVIPPRMPPVLQATGGTDGTIWLRRPTPARTPGRYTVLEADGRVRGDVMLPAGARLVAVLSDKVWTVQYDPDGIPMAVRYRVR